MMRPISLLCMLLAIGSGLHLYRVKYRAQVLDREIQATLRAADDTRARAGLLRADYALLNDPIRLQELVDQHLQLKSTQPGQFTTLAEMERRLPPIGIAPPEPPPEPEIPAAVIRPEPRAPVAEPRAPEPRIVERPATVVAAAIPRPAAPPPRPVAIMPVPAMPSVSAAPRPPTPLALPGAAAPAMTQAARLAPAPTPAQAWAPTQASITPVSLRSALPPTAASTGATPSSAAATATPGARPSASAQRPVAAASPPSAEAPPVVVRSSLGMARRSPNVENAPTAPGGGGAN